MSRFLDRLLGFCASLRLAIIAIVLLAAYLALGTLYESRFGVRATQLQVYQSSIFYAILALLALNVMAAAVVRWPWKKHQAGFVVTHIGIEILLLGCLIGARWGVDGRMTLRGGESGEIIDTAGEHVAMEFDGRAIAFSLEDVMRDAYPSPISFAFSDFWRATDLSVARGIPQLLGEAGGARVQFQKLSPAVRVAREYVASETSDVAAAKVRVSGKTPDGRAVDQAVWFSTDGPAELFGGQIRFRFRMSSPPMSRPRGELVLAREGDQWRATVLGGGVVRESFNVELNSPRSAWMGLSVSILEILPNARAAEQVTPINVPAARVDAAIASVELSILSNSEMRQVTLLRGERPNRVEVGGKSIDLSYRFDAVQLPFAIELLETKSPAAGVPRAKVRVKDVEYEIAPNAPAVVDGRSIYLTAVESVGGENVAFLSVRRDPGWIVKYVGSGLIVLGTVMMFVIRKSTPPPCTQGGGGSDARTSDDAQLTSATQREPMISIVTSTENNRKERQGRQERQEKCLSLSLLGALGVLCGNRVVVDGRIARPGEEPSPLPPSLSTGRGSTRYLTNIAIFLVMVFATAARAAVDLSAARPIPVQYGDRIAPLDAVARETVRFIRGRETADSLRTMLDWSRDPASAEQSEIIVVPRIELRTKLGLSESEKFISPANIRANKEAMAWMADLAEKKRRGEETGEVVNFTSLESAAMDVRNRLTAFDNVVNRSVYRISTIAALASREQIVEQFVAASESDQNALNEISKNVRSGSNEDEATRLVREVAFLHVHPFRWVAIAYAISLCAMIAARIFRRGKFFPTVLVVLAISAHAAAFTWRCLITGWAPVTNMYETVIWVGGVAAVIGFVLSITSKTPIAAVAGVIVALLACVVGDVIPPQFGKSIQTLPAVLQSNLWLTVHVLTVVSSYAAFAVALVLANVALWRMRLAVGGLRLDEKELGHQSIKPQTSNLNHLIYRTIQIGVVLIAAGTVLGAMWADVSWGRFWGWDPKEVWALIVLLSYLALLHGKVAGWVGDFGLAAGAVICFLTVLMSWYGVNFVLGVGLHSYGFGAGGIQYVLSFVALQLAYLIWASWKRKLFVVDGRSLVGSETSPTTNLQPATPNERSG